MHTIDLLEEALTLASRAGWTVRHEWLGGHGGGACRLGKKHLLFVDRSQTAAEQFDQVVTALRQRLLPPATPEAGLEGAGCGNLPEMSVELKRCLLRPLPTSPSLPPRESHHGPAAPAHPAVPTHAPSPR
jgi:hypothetical protein